MGRQEGGKDVHAGFNFDSPDAATQGMANPGLGGGVGWQGSKVGSNARNY